MKLNEKIVSQFKLALKEEGLRFTSQRLAVLEDIFRFKRAQRLRSNLSIC